MNQSSIMQRLVLIAAIPLTALTISAGALIWDSFSSYRGAELTKVLMTVTVSAGDLIHVLQIERGTSAGFLQSKGEKFADTLPGLRKTSDSSLQALRAQLSAISNTRAPEFSAAAAAALKRIEQLDAMRSRIDKFAVPVPEEVAFYSAIIQDLVTMIGTSTASNSDATITQKIFAYLALIRGKDNAGLERALTTAAFSANQVSPAQFRAIVERIVRQDAEFDRFNATASAEERSLLNTAIESTSGQEVRRLRTLMAERAVSGGFEVAPSEWFKAMSGVIDGMRKTEELTASTIVQSADKLLQSSQTVLMTHLLLGAVAILVTLGVSVWVGRSVSGPLKSQVDVASRAIRQDDFTQDVPEHGPTEVVHAGHAFNQLMKKFRTIIADTKSSSNKITDAAHSLAASSRQVSESSMSQSDAASAVAAAVEQASVSVSETSSNARVAANAVTSAGEETKTALEVMGDTVQRMERIARLINESGQSVAQLNDSSRQIGGIVKVIKDIAQQTNLLALNAAIEAARAGEHGRGFAIVADEVRKLAERSADATEEISTLILLIQTHVDSTVGAMKLADDEAVESLVLAAKAETALQRIGDGSRAIAENVLSISDALREQDTAIQEVAVNVERIAQMTELNCKTATLNNQTAKQLDQLSSELMAGVAHFKV